MVDIKIRKNKYHIIAVALLLIFSLQVITSINKHSTLWDEPIHIFQGYYLLKTGKLAEYAGNAPQLTGQIASLPLLFFDLDYSSSKRNYFVYKNKISPEIILFLSRLMMLVFYLLLGVYVFIWSRELFGKKAALFALFLFAFSPNLIAHSKFVTHDLPVTALMFIATYHFWKFMKKPSYKTAIIGGLTFGIAQTTKFSALLLIPIFFILFVSEMLLKNRLNIKKTIRNKRTYRIAGLCIIGLIVAGFFISLDYKFIKTIQPIAKSVKEDPIIDPSKYNIDMVIDKFNPLDIKVVDSTLTFFFYKMPPLLPYDYIRGIFGQLMFQKGYFHSFIMGEYSNKGWWYYYPVAFLIKTPIPTLVFLLTALILFFISSKRNKNLLYLFMPILIIFCFFSFFNKMDAGLRYILPMYPFMFVFISNIINAKIKKLNFIILLLCIWYVISAVFIYPYHYSYFNESIGGPKNGHKFLVENNLDIGQDIKGLAEYIKKNNIKGIKISYYNLDPAYYGIEYENIGSDPSTIKPDCKPLKGLIAVSATNLESVYFDNHNCFDWIKKYKPIDHIGYSIFIYDIK